MRVVQIVASVADFRDFFDFRVVLNDLIMNLPLYLICNQSYYSPIIVNSGQKLDPKRNVVRELENGGPHIDLG